VVEKTADTKLLGSGTVPAGPVPSAGGLVAEDTVQSSAVISLDGRIGYLLAAAVVAPPRVVAALGDAPVLADEDEAVGAVVELGHVQHALPVAITVRGVPSHPRLHRAGVHLPPASCRRLTTPLARAEGDMEDKDVE